MKKYIKPSIEPCETFEDIAVRDISIFGRFNGTSRFIETAGEDNW